MSRRYALQHSTLDLRCFHIKRYQPILSQNGYGRAAWWHQRRPPPCDNRDLRSAGDYAGAPRLVSKPRPQTCVGAIPIWPTSGRTRRIPPKPDHFLMAAVATRALLDVAGWLSLMCEPRTVLARRYSAKRDCGIVLESAKFATVVWLLAPHALGAVRWWMLSLEAQERPWQQFTVGSFHDWTIGWSSPSRWSRPPSSPRLQAWTPAGLLRWSWCQRVRSCRCSHTASRRVKTAFQTLTLANLQELTMFLRSDCSNVAPNSEYGFF